jgi:hypothetical protein
MNETQTRQLILKTFRRIGRVHEEVWLKHPASANDWRIDFLVETELEAPRLRCFGVEAKGLGNGNKDDSAALRQCVDYANCIITDTRLGWLNGQPMSSVFLFSPSTLESTKNERTYDWWTATRIMATFGVGIATRDAYDGISLVQPLGHPLWSERTGVGKFAATWQPVPRIGHH